MKLKQFKFNLFLLKKSKIAKFVSLIFKTIFMVKTFFLLE